VYIEEAVYLVIALAGGC